ncbi:zinc finger BED domain-containing protein 5 [Nephila pilipes]|uniref:Zinc finger BED domain-containing protein 5 n=1 Tax=Nephila pilipes TaxID=299642 RepID=A0A8X6TSE5_NEPPI|nr:zinc finger BED domain-containing protein 5 [Nephila pilipes]
MDKFLRRKDSSSRTDDEEPSTSVTKNIKKVVKRKYDEDYIKYGFSWCGDETAPRPQCIICGDQLSNESMVPSKLKRYLYSSHPSCANKDKKYFKRCLEQNKIQKKFMKSAVTVSEKALEASFHVAKLIARQKKPHTVGETLIKPACMEIVRLMLGPNEVKEVNKVSLSADTLKRRIHDMSSDILGTLIKKLLSAEKFALQIDETTDIKNKAQLIAIVEILLLVVTTLDADVSNNEIKTGIQSSCAKERKVPDLNASFSTFEGNIGIINAIMNLNILSFVFKNDVLCKKCNSSMDMQVLKNNSGLTISFVLKCCVCPYRVEFSSSDYHEGTEIATVITRYVYAMRSIGRGAEAGRMFCALMNLPQPPTRFAPYNK